MSCQCHGQWKIVLAQTLQGFGPLVYHDDQPGTANWPMAVQHNASQLVSKPLEEIGVVMEAFRRVTVRMKRLVGGKVN